MTAKAREESIVCAIPIDFFQQYVTTNPNVLAFLLESFASQTRNPYDKERKGKLISENMITFNSALTFYRAKGSAIF